MRNRKIIKPMLRENKRKNIGTRRRKGKLKSK